MRAAVYTEYGPPEVVGVVEVPTPTPAGDEVLVEVRMSSVNRTDCGFRAGKPPIVRLFAGLRAPKATILGNEFAGVVTAVGSAVTSFSVGDRVFGYHEGPFGGHAEFVAVKEEASIARIPDGVGFEQAATATEGPHYALAFLAWAKVEPGQHVLVNGATGAIGSAAVQLLVHRGVSVVATCPTDHLELVRSLGAERVIDYTTTDFTQDGDTFDAVLDTVGKSTFGACRRLLTPTGVYVSSELGPWVQNPVLALVTPLLRRRRVRFPVPKHDQAMIRHLADLLGSGDLRSVVDRSFPLDEIVDAYRYVETGQKIGNVALRIADG